MSIGIGSNSVKYHRITLKNADGSYAGSIGWTTPAKVRKKRLNYNFKAISAQLMQAKTSGGARQAAAKARRQIALLQRNLRNDEYDQEEVENAIAHAKGLERVARKRMRHLRQEEALEKGQAQASESEEEYEISAMDGMDPEELLGMSAEELKQLMRELENARKALEDEAAASAEDPEDDLIQDSEALGQMLSGSMEASDLKQLKAKHRSDELREIMEADMKYLKALFNKLVREKQAASSGSSGSSGGSGGAASTEPVSLELSGAEVPVTANVPAAAEGANMDVTV